MAQGPITLDPLDCPFCGCGGGSHPAECIAWDAHPCPATIHLTIAGQLADLVENCGDDFPSYNLNGCYTLTATNGGGLLDYRADFGTCSHWRLYCQPVETPPTSGIFWVYWVLEFYTDFSTGCLILTFGPSTGTACPPLTGAAATANIFTNSGTGGCLGSTAGTATIATGGCP